MNASSSPWDTDPDVDKEIEWKAKESNRRHTYSKGLTCPICGEPMSNEASTCNDCRLQKKDPAVMARKQRQRIERLRKNVENDPNANVPHILATKIWRGRGIPSLNRKAAGVALDRIRKEKEECQRRGAL